MGLSEFGNFGTIDLGEGLNLRELLVLSIEMDETDGMTQQSQNEEIEVFHSRISSNEDYHGHSNSTTRNDCGILFPNNHTRRNSHIPPITFKKLHSPLWKTPLLLPSSRTKRTLQTSCLL